MGHFIENGGVPDSVKGLTKIQDNNTNIGWVGKYWGDYSE